MTHRKAAQVGLAALLGIAAGLGFLGAFAAEDLLGPVLAASLLASAIGWATWRQRTTTIVLALQLAAGVLAYLAILGRTGTDGPVATMATALDDGWSQLLTSVIPAPPEPELLAVPFALAWAATAGAIELCRRTRSPLLPLAPTIGVLLVGELAGPVDADVPIWATLLFLAAGTVLGALRALLSDAPTDGPPPSGPATRRRMTQVAPVAVAVLVLGGVLAPNLPGLDDPDPWRLRETAAEPPVQPEVLHPLAGLAAAYRDGGDDGRADRDDLLLRVTVDREPPTSVDADGGRVVHLPMAAFDRFDGATWSSSEPFRPVGADLPPDLVRPESRTTETVHQEVEVLIDLPGPWLPTLAGPRSVDVDGDLTHDALADVVALDRVPESGTTYEVVSDVPITEGVREQAEPGVPPVPVDFTSLSTGDSDLEPDLGRIRQVAQQLFATPLPFPQQLGRLEDLFNNRLTDIAAVLSVDRAAFERGIERAFAWPLLPATGTTTVPPSTAEGSEAAPDRIPTGHSIGRINSFLYLPNDTGDGEPAEDAGLGTPEQFATSAALIARAQTIPARVVVGYTVPYDGSTTIEVRRRDADAWVEVWSPQGGWIPLDASPKPIPADELVQATTTTASTTTSSSAPPGPAVTAAAVPVTVNEAAPDQASSSTGTRAREALIFLAAAGGVVVLSLVLTVRIRRRRRQRGDPAVRLDGAWQEALHTLHVAGLDVSTAQSPAEVASAAAGRGLPTEDLRSLGRLVLRGAHASTEPQVGDAGMAWHHVGAMRRAVSRSLPPAGRLRLQLDPRTGIRRPRRVPRPGAAPRQAEVPEAAAPALDPDRAGPPLVGTVASGPAPEPSLD